MPPLRSRSQPAPRSLPRDALPSAAVPAIDAGLKALRSAAKRVRAVADSHNVELSILVRLHYKNNNQHRGALWWRRVEQLKRTASRLEELSLPGLLDDLRLAFHAPPDAAQASTKKIKSAWSRAPDADYLAFVLERVHSACLLVDASKASYQSIYGFLARTAAGGAFLSLMLMLSAMTSRFALLLDELRDALHAVWDALRPIYDCVETVSPAAQKPPPILPKGARLDCDKPRDAPPVSDEDLGESLARPASTVANQALAGSDAVLLEEPAIDTLGLTPEPQPVLESRIETVVVPRSVPVKAAKPKPVKKKKAKKDEIDLIFG
ncbi:hypothetical protein AURDEDRAFT_157598 [Auricularia subglabra TFB-10046 SS5]|nr:hypothetical protein AURDEDRAFT_157598 [Auricularia subglabra TFB-10046 SS5]